MSATYVTYQATGSAQLFSIPFPFLNPAFITVSRASGPYIKDVDYVVEGTNVRFLHYPPVGVLTIKRTTPIDALLVPFADGSLLNARVLSSANTQALHGLEETREYIDSIADDLRANLTPADSPLIASQLSGMEVSLGNVSSSITMEQTVRATNEAALVSAVNTMWAVTGAAQALSQTGGVYQANWTGAQATQWADLRTEVFTKDGMSIRAALTSEVNARTTAVSALATSATALTARVGAAETAITTNQTASTTQFAAQGTSITALTTRMGTAETAITTTNTALSTQYGALGTSITNLTTRMNGAESAITTTQTTQANQWGQLSAQYTVKLDVNGAVAGFGLASEGTVAGGTTSAFTIRADRFYVAMPGLGSYCPFYIGGGTVTFDGATTWAKVGGINRPADNATVGANASNLNIGLGTNLLPNTEFVGGFSPAIIGWNPSAANPLALRADDVWRPRGSQALQIHIPTRSGNQYNVGTDVYLLGGYGDYHYGIPVTAGKRYEFSGKVASHRCDTGLWFDFFDKDNVAIGGAGTGWGTRNSGGPTWTPNAYGSGWSDACLFAVAPANAAYATVYWRVSDVDVGQVDGFAWLSQPFFGEALQSQTSPSTYSPGYAKGAFSTVDKLTAANIATYMDNAVINNALIGNAAVGTLSIQGEAVVVPRSVSTETSATVSPVTTSTQLASLYIDAGGAKVTGIFTCFGTATANSIGTKVRYALLAPSGAVLAQFVMAGPSPASLSGTVALMGTSYEAGTYTVVMYAEKYDTGYANFTNGSASYRSLLLLGTKR